MQFHFSDELFIPSAQKLNLSSCMMENYKQCISQSA